MNKHLKRIISVVLISVLVFSASKSFTIPVSAEGEEVSSGTVFFGRYMQTEVTDEAEISVIKSYGFEDGKLSVDGVDYAQANGKYYKETAIEWNVLEDDGEYYTLLSKNVLLSSNFGWMDCWDVSYLRAWLNEEFFYDAFTYEEQKDVAWTKVVTTKVPFYAPGAASAGEPYDVVTEDRVYLLSLDEAMDAGYGFSNASEADESRVAYTTPYMSGTPAVCEWWLRGEGRWNYGNFQGSYIEENGSVGYWYQTWSKGVRPVIRVRKDSPYLYSEAPIVASVNTEFVDSNMDVFDSVAELFSGYWADFNYSGYKDPIKGPAFTLMGESVSLFEFDFELSNPFCFKKSEICLKYDEETNVAEVIVGYNNSAKNELDKASKKSSKWENAWEDTKSIVLGLNDRSELTLDYEQGDSSPLEKYKEVQESLTTKKVNFGLEAEAKAVGYFKIQLNENMEPETILEGGVVVDASIGAKYRHYLWGVVYSEFSGEGAVEAQFLGRITGKQIEPMADIEFKFIPGVALGANLIAVDVQGGIKGELSCGIDFPWKNMEESLDVNLKGKVFVNINSVIGLSAEYEHEFRNYISLYPEFGIEEASLEMSFVDEHMLSSGELTQLESVDENIIDDSVIESLVDNHAKPQAEELADGSVLLTYLSDKQEQANGQQTLMYRVNTNGVWSDEKAVYQTECMDTAAEIFTFEDEAYIIYERSQVPFIEGMSATDAAASMEVYVAKFDTVSKTFSEPLILSAANDTYKYEYKLCSREGKLTALWAENSEKDVMLQNGSTKVYARILEDGVWGDAVEFSSSDTVISEFIFGYHGPSEKFINQAGENLYVAGDRYVVDPVENLTYANDKLYYVTVSGELRYIGAYFNYSDTTGIYVSPEFVIDGKNGVYWIEGDNFNSNIFYQSFEPNSEPLQVTYEDGYIESFDLCTINGEDTLIYTLQTVDESKNDIYGGTVLKSTSEFQYNKAEIRNMAYEAKSYLAGEANEFYIEGANIGTTTLHNVKAQFADESDDVFATVDICELLEAGKAFEEDVSVVVPESLDAGVVKVSLVADETLEYVDAYELEIVSKGYDIKIEEKNVYQIAVSNIGDYEAKNVLVRVTDNRTGNVIYSEIIELLTTGETKLFNIKDVYENASGRYGYILQCTISQQDSEINMADNSCVIQKLEDEGIYGDVNGDLIINASDALLVLKHAAKMDTLYGEGLWAAELDCDEVVNAGDALLILKYAAKLIDRFPVQGQ